jgi:hypothetical protein
VSCFVNLAFAILLTAKNLNNHATEYQAIAPPLLAQVNTMPIKQVISLKISTLLLLVLNCICTQALHAQVTGGRSVFQHLSLSPSARITALGGAAIAIKDQDLSLALHHPSALHEKMSGRISFQHQFYLSDLQNGAFSYARHFPKIKATVQTGIQYMKYGDIAQADVTGTKAGTIQTGEWAWTIGAGRQLTPKLSLGLNLRLAGAQFAEYQSNALLADMSMMYVDTARRNVFAFVVKQAGTQLTTFNGIRENLPLDVQLGFSKRLRYLPFRLGIIMHHLQQWDIRYNNPNDDTGTTLFIGNDQPTGNDNAVLDNFFRHLIFNGEFILGRSENLFLRFGYNHLRKRELSVQNLRSLAGFSGGIGLKVKRFQVDMGYAAYHLAGGGFQIGIGTDLDSFRK